ncbi:MAG TPA: DUF1318 domain-containing protein [Lentisphaeria bacterium]|nr:MAG: hypothetical protein A2X47_07535 [Lentisphaerae bacterium GWF2_38_69]HBM16590.1 DUF1318 domain-containing protein [Lentisphaeria bacterium]
MNSNILKLFTVLSLMLSVVVTAYSDDIKDRMSQRLSQLIALKDKGIIGEDQNGYLAFVGSSKEGQAIVDAENADRKTVYQMIAEKTGTTLQIVGKQRAIQLAQNETTGHYIQKNGKWVKK